MWYLVKENICIKKTTEKKKTYVHPKYFLLRYLFILHCQGPEAVMFLYICICVIMEMSGKKQRVKFASLFSYTYCTYI